MTVTIKDASLKQPIQGMLKGTTAKSQMYKYLKRNSSAKKEDLLMLCKKGSIPKQHAFFHSPTVTTSGRQKDDTDSNSDSDSEEDQSSDTH